MRNRVVHTLYEKQYVIEWSTLYIKKRSKKINNSFLIKRKRDISKPIKNILHPKIEKIYCAHQFALKNDRLLMTSIAFEVGVILHTA